MAESQTRYHCHKCLWFYAVDDTDPSEENWTGECRRYAPSPYKYPVVGGVDSGDTVQTNLVVVNNTAVHWKWPYCEGGWFCGDFKPYDGAFTE